MDYRINVIKKYSENSLVILNIFCNFVARIDGSSYPLKREPIPPSSFIFVLGNFEKVLEKMTEEIWKPVVGYEGLYEVSNLGNVKSLDRVVKNLSGDYIKSGAIKKQSSRPRGYRVVTLTKNGNSKRLSVHRLVAMAFISNPYNYPEVDHIDRDPSNNIVENLRWCSHEDNMNNENSIQYMKNCMDKKEYSVLGLAAKTAKGSVSAPKPLHQYTKDGQYITSYKSHNEASRITGIERAAIEGVLDKIQYSAGGFMWSSKLRDDFKYKPTIHSFFKPIQRIDTVNNIIGEWDSITKAAKALGVSRKYISARIKTGEFRYKNGGE